MSDIETSPEGSKEDLPPDSKVEAPDNAIAGLTEARDRYRGERDEARALVEQFQRREVERLAGEHLAMAQDFWLSGNEIGDYLDEQGSVDPAKVEADALLLLEERPGLGQFHRAGYDPTQGQGSIPKAPSEPTFADLFRG